MQDTTPVTPGAIIGYRRDGRPVRLIGGGSEPAPQPPANGGGEPVAPPASEPTPAPPPAADPAASAGQQQGGDAEPPSGGTPSQATVDDLPQWAQRLVRDLRSENAATRTRAKENAEALAALRGTHEQQMDGIARALGLKPDETTPEQLAAARDAANADRDAAIMRERASRVELAAYRAAAATGADPSRLLDSRAFVATLDGLDPSSPDFGQQVADKVAAAVEQNPAWKIAAPPVPGAPPGSAPPPLPVPQPPVPSAPPVPASGPQGSFGTPPSGPRQLTSADAKNMTPEQVVKAMNEGAFTGEGFGPSRKLAR